MKSFDELADRFESIPELPVSEEMLGAYMEGNIDAIESSFVAGQIADNMALSDIFESINDENMNNLSTLDEWINEDTSNLSWNQSLDICNIKENMDAAAAASNNNNINDVVDDDIEYNHSSLDMRLENDGFYSDLKNYTTGDIYFDDTHSITL